MALDVPKETEMKTDQDVNRQHQARIEGQGITGRLDARPYAWRRLVRGIFKSEIICE